MLYNLWGFSCNSGDDVISCGRLGEPGCTQRFDFKVCWHAVVVNTLCCTQDGRLLASNTHDGR